MNEINRASLPLSGVKIVDLSSVLLGPKATRLLADLGASVWKIESLEGDTMRRRGSIHSSGISSLFAAFNANKYSIALDLKKPEGAMIAKRMVKHADVFVHNMRVKAINRLGLDYKTLNGVNEQIIYCAATGFDQRGPYANDGALDDIGQAASGCVDLMGRYGGGLQYIPTLLGDKLTGVMVATAIISSLYRKEKTGLGQLLEVPMFETLTSFILDEHLGGNTFNPPAGPGGYGRILDGGRHLIETLDGSVAVLPYGAKQWKRVFEALKCDDINKTTDWSDEVQVNDRGNEFLLRLEREAKKYTLDQFVQICRDLDIPVSAVFSIENVLEHPQMKKNNLMQSVENGNNTNLFLSKAPIKLDGEYAPISKYPPTLGADSEYILEEIGYDSDDIRMFREKGIIVHETKYK